MKQTKEDKEWAKKVKQRDGNECAINGCDKITMLNAHHIIPKENMNYRYDLTNGITLCPFHHRFSRKISAHQNPFAFFLWLEEYRPHLFMMAKSRLTFRRK